MPERNEKTTDHRERRLPRRWSITVQRIMLSTAPLAVFAACGASAPLSTATGGAAASGSNRSPSGYGYEFAPDSAEKVAAAPASPKDGSPLGEHGRLTPEPIQNVVRGHFGATLSCYEIGRKKNAKLTGKVTVRFVIGEDGATREAKDDGSTLPDPEVIQCIVEDFKKRHFPESKDGNVTVVYPIELGPSATPQAVSAPLSDTRPYGYEFSPDSAELVKKEPLPQSFPTGSGGRLFPEAIRGVVRRHFDDVLGCYEIGQKKNAKLAGIVNVKSSFGRDGVPTEVVDQGSTLPDKEVVDCVVAVFRKLRYPESRGGTVTFIYPIKLGS